MTENDLSIHNIALRYNVYTELHPDDAETTIFHIAANYDKSVSELKETSE